MQPVEPTGLCVVQDMEPRPRTRGDCLNGPRPCPWVSCRYNLYLDISALNGAVILRHPTLEPWEMTESCALDVADRGASRIEGLPNSHEEVGRLLGVATVVVARTERSALDKLRTSMSEEFLDD